MTTQAHELSRATALVTGGAQRIGRSIALALGASGMNIVVHYRRSAAAAETAAEEIRRLGVRAWTVEADLADVRNADALWEKACELAGPIDALINNASEFPDDRLTDVSVDSIEASFRLHAWAPLIMSRRLAAQGRNGAIVNLLDARVGDYDRNHAGYHLSKRTLFALTRMMALEFAPRVRVNGVAPGLILPPPGKGPEYLEALAATNPLRRCGNPASIAKAVLFLIESDFVTGQVIFVDGGRHLRGLLHE